MAKPAGWLQPCADFAIEIGCATCTSEPPLDPGVSLYAQLDLAALGTGASEGNDCWGYVSATGREYALMGVSNALVVVEITTPNSPVVIDSVPHAEELHGDVKTYQDYAYVVNEGGGDGLDVVDLSDVDNGNVIVVPWVDDFSISHNVAIDTTSGYLYLCGANIHGGRLVAYDLSNPDNPVQVGAVSSVEGVYVHDAQVVTYTTGPNAGKQIAFCANGGTGVDIYDVTDKSNMFRLSRTTYPNLGYCHQCWLSDDRQYLYINDEADGNNQTVVLDVTDLENPQLANLYSSCLTAGDHNLYFSDGFIYEADYAAGMRIFCADDLVNPVQVGWYDTYPSDDFPGFKGAWSVYPFFPSGTVIVSDRQGGLFVVDPSEALAACGPPCPWDCDGSGDGAVSVIDLLAILIQWDLTNPPCDGGGSCDFDGSGCVDVVDLLKWAIHFDPAGVGCP